MIYNLNYITCSHIWGIERGLVLIKYYDTNVFLGMLTACSLNFIFPGDENIFKIFKLFICAHVASIILLYIVKTDNKKA